MKAGLHEPVDQFVDCLAAAVKVLGGKQPVPLVKGAALFNPALSLVEIGAQRFQVGLVHVRDFREVGARIRVLRVHRVAIEKLGDGIESEIVEKGLEVHSFCPAVCASFDAV